MTGAPEEGVAHRAAHERELLASSLEALGEAREGFCRRQGLQSADGLGHALHSHRSLDFGHGGAAVEGTSRVPVTRRLTRALTVLSATTATALGVGGIVLGASPASATDADPALPARVVAVPADSGILLDEADLSVRITVTNTSGRTITGARAELRFDDSAVTEESVLRSWLTDTTVPSSASVVSVPLVDIGPGSTAVATLTLTGDEIDLDETGGVRLVSVTVRAENQVVGIDRTAVVGRPAGTLSGISSLTAVVPLTAPGARNRLLSTDDLSTLTSPGGALDRALETGIGRGVVFAIDPRIIASIRVLGDAAPASATDFLTRLEEAPNDSFALRWADADPVATVGLLDEPLPALLGPGTAALIDTAPAAEQPEPSASPSPDAPTADRIALDELTAWPHTLDGWVWPQPGTLSSEGAVALVGDGVTSALLPESDVTGGDGLLRTVAAGMRAVVADDLAGHAVSSALDGGSRHVRSAAVVELGALLSVAPNGNGSPPMVILADREDAASPQGLGALLDEVVALPWVRGGGLATSTVPTAPESEAALIENEPDESQVALIEELLSIESSDAQFARIAVQPELLREDRRLDLLTALSIGGESLPESTERYRQRSAQLQSGVQVVESNTITLLTDRTSLPVTVQNSLPVPVRVFVRVDAATGQLRIEDQRVETTVGAGAQARALIPVQSLVNGEVDITVSVRAEDGAVVGSPIRVELNLQAGWETAGTIAIGAVIALLFGVGLFRDIRKRRAGRASADGSDPSPATTPADTNETSAS